MTNIASFSFDPISVTTKEGDLVSIDILMHSGSSPVISADAWIAYDPKILTPIIDKSSGLKPGNLFQLTDAKIISPGSMYIYAINQLTSKSDIANGKLATVNFKAIASGSTELSFNCDSYQKQTSQIIKYDPALTNIINCTASKTHTATINIENSSVLGAQTDYYSKTKNSILLILFAIFIGVLYFRFRHFSKKIAISKDKHANSNNTT